MDIARLRKKLQKEREESERRKRAASAKPSGDEPAEGETPAPKGGSEDVKHDVPAELAGGESHEPTPADEAEEIDEADVIADDVDTDAQETQAAPIGYETGQHSDDAPPLKAAQSPAPEDTDAGRAVGGFAGMQEDDEDSGGKVEVLTFRLGEELYAFRVFDLKEVLVNQEVTKIPRSEAYVVGIISLRGKILPVLDLKRRLGLVSVQDLPNRNIIILKGGDKGILGVAVDSLIDVMEVEETEIVDPPAHLADSASKFLEGVIIKEGNFTSIINPDELSVLAVGGGVNEPQA